LQFSTYWVRLFYSQFVPFIGVCYAAYHMILSLRNARLLCQNSEYYIIILKVRWPQDSGLLTRNFNGVTVYGASNTGQYERFAIRTYFYVTQTERIHVTGNDLQSDDSKVTSANGNRPVSSRKYMQLYSSNESKK